MEEIIPDRALKKERAYTGREVRIDLRRINRPPKERKRLCHPASLDFMVFTTSSQKVNLLGSPPIERPKYNKRILPTLQFNIEAASFNQESAMFTPTNILLLKFTFKPDILANNTQIRPTFCS